ncbi:hypothetical protein OOJ91_12225 [Micromonospora lupini]|uniref:hypothetical protein n=1 Tax=Micromonospora lupini TaxID=285679 RepID=UPI00225898FE|nr:hypothetical protein [Micromonospora lupini]MCX5066645.1 hypothetical protein [Micromonospora lupini]
MPASRAQRAATAERRGKAVAMRLAGLDYQTIADRLGYADRAAAHKDITRALESNVAEMHRNADVLRQEELDRLNRLQAGLWPTAAAGDPKAVTAVLGIIDRRCKLLGLDAPVRHEVVTLDAIDNAIQELAAELGRDQVGEAASAPAPA